MIDLFKVKRFNEYDFVQDGLPASDGTWLCGLTAGVFVRGYSYQVTSGVATRIEQIQDDVILDEYYNTFEGVLMFLNNYFYVKRQSDTNYTQRLRDYELTTQAQRQYELYESASGNYQFNSNKTISNIKDNPFLIGDYVQVRETTRNNTFGMIDATDVEQITIDSDLRTIEENSLIMLCDVPSDLVTVINRMVNYDAFKRDGFDEMASESIGNYSYSKNNDMMVNGLSYPPYLAQSVIKYKKVRFTA